MVLLSILTSFVRAEVLLPLLAIIIWTSPTVVVDLISQYYDDPCILNLRKAVFCFAFVSVCDS